MTSNGNPSNYLAAIRIEGLKPFVREAEISFTDKILEYNPVQWTIILGNNNTGKTRLLRTIATVLSVFSGESVSIKDSYSKWVTKEAADILFNEKLELDLAGAIDEVHYKEAVDTARQRIKSLSTVMAATVFRNEVLDSIYEGDYHAAPKEMSTIDHCLLQDRCMYIPVLSSDASPFIIGYGVNRKVSSIESSNVVNYNSHTANLFFDNGGLLNVENWLIQTDYASKNGVPEAVSIMQKIRSILVGGILPDVKDFKLTSIKDRAGVKNYVEFLTDYGWTRLDSLGYGYQASITWLLDLAKRMLDQYPDQPDPLSMPAIVLVDEIDLHLHPSWQRKILNYLSNIFPNVQFIVTAHSPLVIQSANEVNLVLLKKEDDHISISQPTVSSYKGWSIEEILSELMGLEDKVHSDSYLELMKTFDEALDDEDYEKANQAYKQLDNMLPIESGQRKLLRIQMASLNPDN